MGTCHIGRTEHGQSVVIGKIHYVAVGMHADTVDILFSGQTITVHMTNEFLLMYIILPDTHRCRAPDITVLGLDNVSHNLVSQTTSSFKRLSFLMTGLVAVDALFCADQNLSCIGLAERITHRPLQQSSPTIWQETVAFRIIARYTNRRGHPHMPFTVGHHRHHPVVQ